MSQKKTDTRRAGYFGEQQHGGLELDGERVSVSPSTAYVNRSTQAAQRTQLAERRRTEQQCRGYWRRMYGTRAEIASRGGVSWVGGVRRV